MIRQLIATLLLLLSTTAVAAAETPTFFIERIDVREAVRVSKGIVLAEARLREGSTVGEADLREASDRLTRAPFLLSATLSLEKGTERGHFVLVISVREAKPFFFDLDLRAIRQDRGAAIAPAYSEDTPGGNRYAFGYRHFVGSRGALHLALAGRNDNRDYTADYSAIALGYTQYDILGTRAFATVSLQKPGRISGTNTKIVPQVVVGFPLSPTQTVTVAYEEFIEASHTSTPFDFNGHVRQRLFTASWAYDTTNRPILPTRGTRLTVTPLAVRLDQRHFQYFAYPTPPIPFESVQHSAGLEGTLSHWYELTERDSVRVGAEGGWARIEERGTVDRNFDSRFGVLRTTLSHSLWNPARVGADGDNRLELDLLYGRTGHDAYPRTLGDTPRVRERSQATISWVRRNAWGTFRLGGGVAW